MSKTWGCTPVNAALRRLGQEKWGFVANLGYKETWIYGSIVEPCLPNQNKIENTITDFFLVAICYHRYRCTGWLAHSFI